MTIAPNFERKNIRLPSRYYRGKRLHFLTLCFAGRRRFGASPRTAAWLIGHLRRQAAECAFALHAYCVMPDHLHVLAPGLSEESNLLKFVESFKQSTGVEFSQRSDQRLWQVKYYDHILRGADSADRVAWYIWMNPVRQSICRAPKDYPFLGSFTEIGNRMLRGAVAPEWIPEWKKAVCRAEGRGATFNSRKAS